MTGYLLHMGMITVRDQNVHLITFWSHLSHVFDDLSFFFFPLSMPRVIYQTDSAVTVGFHFAVFFVQ